MTHAQGKLDQEVGLQTVGELVDKFRRARAKAVVGSDEVDDGLDELDEVEDNIEDDEFVATDDSYTYVSDLTPKEEWENVVTQLQQLLFFVVVPLTGKFLGRRFAHKLWSFIGTWYYKNQ